MYLSVCTSYAFKIFDVLLISNLVSCDVDISNMNEEEIFNSIKTNISEENYLDAFKLCKHAIANRGMFTERRYVNLIFQKARFVTQHFSLFLD